MTAALEKWKANNGQLDLTNEEDYSDISVLQSMLAGVGSGLIAIPKVSRH